MNIVRSQPLIDPHLREGGTPSSSRMATTDRLARGITGSGGTTVTYRNGKIDVYGGASGLDLSKFCFGVTFSGATATIKSGEVHWGANSPTAVMADAGPITLTADYQYLGIEFDPATPSVVAIGPSADVAIFRSDSGMFRTWLCQCRLISGKASLYRIGHVGNIEIPGWFGA